MENICGYLVVRKPEENYEKISRAPYYLPNSPPCVKKVCYAGLDRVPWYELEESYYSGILPDEYIILRNEIYELNQPYLDIKVLNNFDKAKSILDYSNARQDRYELIAVYSEKLVEIKGEIKTPNNINWLGVDIYYSGYGSQLLEGVFKEPNLFLNFIEKINRNGLLDNDIDIIDSYGKEYNQLSLIHNLEMMNNLDISLKDIIHVGLINL